MVTIRRVNGEGTSGIVALVVLLGTPQHQDMLEARVAMVRNRGSWLIAQKRQLGWGILALAEGVNVYTGAKGLPGELPLVLPNVE
jgi:hypothetical protein